MNVKLTAAWFYGALIIVLSAWTLHGFLESLLAACVTAIASWPLYERFAARLRPRIGRSATSLVFTFVVTLFVLAPLMFAFGALLNEAHTLLLEVAAVDKQGIAVPAWLDGVPLAGPWLATLWKHRLAHAGALSVWAQHADASALLGWAQLLGRFMVRHLFIIGFTILMVFFLYQHGESLARDFRLMLRHWIGERAEGHVELAARAVRASVNSMLVVALFDGIASSLAYAVAGVPHPALWGAVTGSLALVPFLGYVALIALTLQLAIAGAAAPALAAVGLGSIVLLCGDKIVRPVVARDGMHLGFVWVLTGCLGGFEVLGLVGLVVGPVVLTVARELWDQRVRDVALCEVTPSMLAVAASGDGARAEDLRGLGRDACHVPAQNYCHRALEREVDG